MDIEANVFFVRQQLPQCQICPSFRAPFAVVTGHPEIVPRASVRCFCFTLRALPRCLREKEALNLSLMAMEFAKTACEG